MKGLCYRGARPVARRAIWLSGTVVLTLILCLCTACGFPILGTPNLDATIMIVSGTDSATSNQTAAAPAAVGTPAPAVVATPRSPYAEAPDSYFVLSLQYYGEDDIEDACDEYGGLAEVADFEELKGLFDSGAADFLDSVGVLQEQDVWVNYQGQGWATPDRRYFLERRDGKPRQDFLIHDRLGGDTAWLGSWYGLRLRVLLKLPKDGAARTPAPSPASTPPDGLPANGAATVQQQVNRAIPLAITSADTNYYYLKLRDKANRELVMTIFLHPNSTVTVNVPVGSFVLQYAVGTGWQGTEGLFGDNTLCGEFNQDFVFEANYTYMLTIRSVTGNLSANQISREAFDQ